MFSWQTYHNLTVAGELDHFAVAITNFFFIKWPNSEKNIYLPKLVMSTGREKAFSCFVSESSEKIDFLSHSESVRYTLISFLRLHLFKFYFLMRDWKTVKKTETRGDSQDRKEKQRNKLQGCLQKVIAAEQENNRRILSEQN